MTRKSKREIERQLDELATDGKPDLSLAEVWAAGLRGEDVDVSREQWARMLEDANSDS